MKKLLVLLSFLICVTGNVYAVDTKSLYKTVVNSVVALTVETGDGVYTGTGFFVLNSNLIATCWHVVKEATKITVNDANGKKYPILGIVDYSVANDIALLKTSSSGKFLKLDADMPEPGETVFALGNPKGLNFSFTNGMVSQIQNIDGTNVIQFTCPASPGNSGCPLISERGQVLGIVVASLVEGQNLNFAMPAATLYTLNKNKKESPVQVLTSKITKETEVDFRHNSTTKASKTGESDHFKYMELAWSYSDKQWYDMAEIELNEALAILQDSAKLDYSTVTFDYYLITSTYYNIHEIEKAANLSRKMLKIITNNFEAYKKAEKSDGGTELTIARYYEILGDCNRDMGKLNEAIDFYQISISYCNETEECFLKIANLYKDMGLYAKASKYALECMQKAECRISYYNKKLNEPGLDDNSIRFVSDMLDKANKLKIEAGAVFKECHYK